MNVHIVVKGDTLWKIARQYGISFDELKKVNAHLANPDYIVPGMKIFLPDGGKGTKPHTKKPPKEKMPHYEKPQHEKPPQEKPLPEKPVMPQPKPQPPSKPPMPPMPPVTPVPKPLPPKPEIKPVPKPEVKPVPQPKPPQPKPPQPKPELPKPEEPVCEMPPAMPQPPPQPPVVQPMMIGIPCGWMPIYDADCHPYAHHYYPPAMQPMPQQPQQPMPYPSVPPSLPQQMIRPPHWSHMPESSSMPDCMTDESPVMPGQCPGNSPSNWEQEDCESSSQHQEMKESPEFELTPPAYCPPEQGYIPQPLQPPAGPQLPQGIQAAQHPQYMHLCTSCGSHMTPFPYYGMPPFYAPLPYPPQSAMPFYAPNGNDTMGTY